MNLDIKNRIVGHGSKPASQFSPNPRNPRTHPEKQRRAIAGSLARLGWIQGVIENITTGNLIDGHERIWQALERGKETEVPFIQVELSEEEEKIALAALDYTARMAEYDAVSLSDLIKEIDVKGINPGIQEMFRDMADAFNAEIKEQDFSDFDKELEDLGEIQDSDIRVVVPAKFKTQVIEYLANEEEKTPSGMGKGILKRCGLL